MSMKWSQLSGTNEYQSLSGEQKEKVRAGYFDRNVAPTVKDPAMLPQARAEWDRATLPRPTGAPKKLVPEAAEAEGFGGALKSGAKTTATAVSSAAKAYAGDTEGVRADFEKAQAIPRTVEQQAFTQAVQARADESDDSLWDGLRNVAMSAWEQPKGAAHEVAAQLPNSAVVMGSGYGGFQVGGKIGFMVGGPKGAAIGSLAGGMLGMFLGNAGIETGFIAQEASAEGEATQDELAEARRQGATKGGVITGIDAASMGINRFLFGAPGRAVEGAVSRTLADKGVDMADGVAVRTALNNPEILSEAVQNAEAAFQASMTGKRRIARGATGMTLESSTEGLGEYLGSVAAGLEASYTEAAMESLLSVPQSAVDINISKKLDSPGATTVLTARTLGQHLSPEHAGILQQPDIAPRARIEAAKQIRDALKGESPALSQAWMNHAMQRISQGRPLMEEGEQSFYDALRPLQQHEVEQEAKEKMLALPSPEMMGHAPIAVPPRNAGQVEGAASFFGGGFEGQAPQSLRAEDMTAPNATQFVRAAKGRLEAAQAAGDEQAAQRAAFELRSGLSAIESILAGNAERARAELEARHQEYIERFKAAAVTPVALPAPDTTGRRLIATPEGATRFETQQEGDQRRAEIEQQRQAGVERFKASAETPIALPAPDTTGRRMIAGSDGSTRFETQQEMDERVAAGDADVAQAPVLQNRNRSSVASIEQMTSIAARPDYGRLSFSRDFGNGAPVVEPGAQLPPEQLGREDYAVTAQGRRIPVQYAVVEAEQLLASNNAEGARIPEYEKGVEGRSRAVAGNGRVAGLQRAFQQGNTDEYVDGLAQDSAFHGIPEAVVRSMARPVLVRLMPQEEVTANIGDESNISTTAELSPSEQARNDSRRVQVGGIALSEEGEITRQAAEQFVAAMPQSEKFGLMDGKQPSRAAYERLQNLIFSDAYESDTLLRLQAEAVDPEVRTIMAGLRIAAARMARLRGLGEFDIRGLVVEAAEVAVNAKRSGQSLSQFIEQTDITRNAEIQPILEMMASNIRSAKRIGEQLSNLADTFYNEASRADVDMFGEVSKRPRQELMEEVYGTAEGVSQDEADAGQQPGPASDEGSDGGQVVPPVERDPDPAEGQAQAVDPPPTDPPAEAAPDGAVSRSGPPELTLEQETEGERQAREQQDADARQEEGAQRRREERQAQTEREQAADRQAADDSVDHFELGQSADQQLSGMGDIFSQPQPEATRGQQESASAPDSDDELLNLFLNPPDTPAPPAAESRQKPSLSDRQQTDIDHLDWLVEQFKEAIAEVEGRVYKSNTKRVTAGDPDADGGEFTASTTRSIEAINEARRARNVRSLKDSVASMEKLKERVRKGQTTLSETAEYFAGLGHFGMAWQYDPRSQTMAVAKSGAPFRSEAAAKTGGRREDLKRHSWEPVEVVGGWALRPISPSQSQPPAMASGRVDDAASEAATSPENNLPEPTEAQKEAGNYKKGKVPWNGLSLSIENPKGSKRSGRDRDGSEWSNTMAAHYGYIRGTTGKDGDHVDVFMGDNPESEKVYVIDQRRENGSRGPFDEHKVMLGFNNKMDATLAYKNSYQKGWGVGPMTTTTVADFKTWLETGDTTKPFAEASATTDKAGPSQPQASQSSGKPAREIDDFGETLGGARKHLASVRARLANLTDEEIAKSTLSKMWPKSDIDKIEDNRSAALYYAMREEIPSKPRVAHKLRRWVDTVKMVRSLVDRAESMGPAAFIETLRTEDGLKSFADKVELLGHLERTDWGRIGSVSRATGEYRNESGEMVPGSWYSVQIDGRRQTFYGKESVDAIVDDVRGQLGEASGAPRLKFEVRRNTSTQAVSINFASDSERRPLKTFPTVPEARAYLRDHYDGLVAEWERVKERDNVHKRDVRGKSNAERVGADRRGGRDVTQDEFSEAFGFRGVQFGNWVSQGRGGRDRQGMLNQAYDALLDLAEIVGIPPKAVSLNGELGLAFGARGSGWAAAHYEPGTIVINLTKTHGAGTLAHEWFHALDHYFQRKRGAGPEREKSYITYAPENYYEDKNTGLRLPESEFLPMSRGETSPKGRKFIKRLFNRDDWVLVEGVRPEVGAAFAELVEALNASPMTKRSLTLTKGKPEGYWSRIIERAARSFENYVITRMADQGKQNDYLANVVSPERFVRNADRYPYLLDTEIAPVAEAFDNLFSVLQTRETERGVEVYEDTGLYSGYEREASSLQNRQRGEGRVQEPSDEAGRGNQFDLFNPPEADKRQAYADLFGAVIKPRTVSYLKASTDTITSADDLAHLLAPLRKEAQETFYAVVTDADGKVLRVMRHTKGLKDSASVDPTTVIAEAASIEGAHTIHYGHNHPSGNVGESAADIRITDALNKELDGTGISPGYHVVIGKTQWGGVPSDFGNFAGGGRIEPRVRRVSIPVTERRITKNQALGEVIDGPNAAMTLTANHDNAIFLLNTRHAPVAVIPMTEVEMGTLREGGRVNRILSAINTSNANAAIVKSQGRFSADNVSRMLSSYSGIRVLDAMVVEGGGVRSLASDGDVAESGAWFSRNDSAATGAVLEVEAVERIARNIVSRLGLDRGGIQLEVLATEADLPQVIRQHADKDNATGKVDGVYHKGSLYVVADKVRSEAHVEEIVAHEGLGHFGGRKLFGKEIAKKYDQLFFMLGGANGMSQRLAARGIDFSDYLATAQEKGSKEQTFYLTDEFLSHMHQANAIEALPEKAKRKIAELYGALREWLKRNGLMSLASFSDADLAFLLKRMRESAAQRQAPGADGRPVFMTAMGVRPSHDAITDTPEFKRWFGDSKVVDSKGSPLVVYHGTPDGRFLKSSGIFMSMKDRFGEQEGVGAFWFAKDRSTANSYADDRRAWDYQNAEPEVVPAYIKLENPLIVDGAGREWREAQAIGKTTDVIEKAQADGHDGVIISNVRDDYNNGPRTRATDTYVVFNSKQIKHATDNVGTFDPANSDIRFSRSAPTADDVMAEKLGLGKPQAESLANKIRELKDRDWLAATETFGQRSEEWLFDGLVGIKRAEEAAGKGIAANDFGGSGYVGARLATGVADTMHAILHYGAPEWRDGVAAHKEGTRGLLDIFGALGNDLDGWLGWMAGNRGAELMAQGRENNLTQEDIDSLMSLATGKEELFQQAKEEYRAMNRAMLDFAEGAGLIDPDGRSEWESEWYIPFYRHSEADGDSPLMAPRTKRGLSHQTSGIKALKGGETATNDLLENIITNWMKLADASMKNSALVKTVDNLRDSDFLSDETVRWQQVVVSKTEIAKRIKSDRKTMAAVAEFLGLDPGAKLDQVANELAKVESEGFEKLWGPVAPTDPDIIRIQRNGRSEYFRVNDPSLLRAVTHLSNTGFQDPVTRAGRWFKRLLTTGVTTSPDFILRNFIRDAVHAWAINPDGFKLGTDSIKGIQGAIKEDAAYRDLMFSGASFQGGYVHGTDPEATAQIIRRTLEKKGLSRQQVDAHMGSLLDTPAKMRSALMRGWQTYRSLGDKVENSSRLSTYKAAVASGKSLAQSVFEAKDLMDYSLRGNLQAMMWLTDVVPFLNARLQGLYKLGRAANANRQEVGLALGKIAMFSVALAMLNDDDERYQELEDWDKDMYWHFWLGDDHFRIPKPFEIGIMAGTIPERIYHTWVAGNQPNEKLHEAFKHAVFATLGFNPLPQALIPAIEVWGNRSFFFDTPVESQADRNKRPEDRYGAYTSETMIRLGQMFGASPKQLQHLWEGYTGTMGAYALATADMMTRGAGRAPRPEWRVADLPAVKAFYRGSDPARSTQHLTDFYDRLEEVGQLYQSIKAYSETDPERARRLLDDNREKLATRDVLNRVNRQLSELRKSRSRVMNDPDMSPKAKREVLNGINAQMNRLTRQVKEVTEAAF